MYNIDDKSSGHICMSLCICKRARALVWLACYVYVCVMVAKEGGDLLSPFFARVDEVRYIEPSFM